VNSFLLSTSLKQTHKRLSTSTSLPPSALFPHSVSFCLSHRFPLSVSFSLSVPSQYLQENFVTCFRKFRKLFIDHLRHHRDPSDHQGLVSHLTSPPHLTSPSYTSGHSFSTLSYATKAYPCARLFLRSHLHAPLAEIQICVRCKSQKSSKCKFSKIRNDRTDPTLCISVNSSLPLSLLICVSQAVC
jgi:hypothetical protein